MALIVCPECGQSVSDKAKSCIHCGFPLEKENFIAKIRFPSSGKGLFKQTIKISNADNDELLAEGTWNEIVEIKIDKPMKLRIQKWGGWDKTFDVKPINNAKYQLLMHNEGLHNVFELHLVDVFDSRDY